MEFVNKQGLVIDFSVNFRLTFLLSKPIISTGN